jgi:hypothetical protein
MAVIKSVSHKGGRWISELRGHQLPSIYRLNLRCLEIYPKHDKPYSFEPSASMREGPGCEYYMPAIRAFQTKE